MSEHDLKLIAFSMCIDINKMHKEKRTNINIHAELYQTETFIAWIYDGNENVEKLETYDMSMTEIVSKLAMYHAEIVDVESRILNEITQIKKEILERYESSNLKAADFKKTLIKCIANMEEMENE